MKLLISMVAALSLVACGKKDDKPAASAPAGSAASAPAAGAAPAAAPAGGDCIVGEYEWNEKGTMRGFVFNADKSGKEIYEVGKDERPLTWSIKDAKTVHISYTKSENNAGGEFDIPYDCTAGTVGIISTPYKRKAK